MTDQADAGSEPTARVALARRRAAERRAERGARLRPLALLVLAVVVVPAALSHPRPSGHGTGLGVTLALVAYAGAVAFLLRRDGGVADVAAIVAIAGGGVALAALQPHGLVELAPSVAVWTAFVRLPPRAAAVAAAAVIAGLDGAIAAGGVHVGESIAASTLLCLVLAASAYFMRRATESRDEIEVLLAELEDAREAETRAAAAAERTRIARELHDVLAHSLSALTIQLEGARLLATRDGAARGLRDALERAGELAKEGLGDARRAVGALRGDEQPALAALPELVDRFRRLDLDVSLAVEGEPRALAAETSLALYRAAQEALTNALRYAGNGTTTVILRYGEAAVSLAVEDRDATAAPLAGAGGGNGLVGMRERVEALGGTMAAGATAAGFRVEVAVPA